MKTTFLAREALGEPRTANDRTGALFARVGERIHRYFWKTVWNPEEAEELAHRTVAELLASVREGRYDGSRSFNAWIWIKAHSIFVDWCRERDRRAAPLPEHVAARADGRLDQKLDAEAILKAVQRDLGDEVYEVFVLTYEGGLTRDEVAEAVGRDRRTVTKRLEQAQALIARMLEQRRTQP